MKTNLKLTQNGRSMVEMLGVLAIIGVLSVAGVQGYTVAMNKHRANEILNEASKRAVVVAAQIASGRTPTLTEFTDNEVGGATFSQEVKDKDGGDWTTEDSQFKIGFTKEPSEAVLAQMKNIAGENGMIHLIDDEGLTFSNTLSKKNSSSNSETEEESDPAVPQKCDKDHISACDESGCLSLNSSSTWVWDLESGYAYYKGQCVACTTVNESDACCKGSGNWGIAGGACCFTGGDSEACCKLIHGADAVYDPNDPEYCIDCDPANIGYDIYGNFHGSCIKNCSGFEDMSTSKACCDLVTNNSGTWDEKGKQCCPVGAAESDSCCQNLANGMWRDDSNTCCLAPGGSYTGYDGYNCCGWGSPFPGTNWYNDECVSNLVCPGSPCSDMCEIPMVENTTEEDGWTRDMCEGCYSNGFGSVNYETKWENGKCVVSKIS